MTDTTQFAGGTIARDGGEDLSDEIIRSVEKNPGDLVRCTRVSVDGYRCNWWAPQATAGYDNPRMTGLLVTTHRVRRSRFLRVTKDQGHLVIRELPLRPADDAR
jgi:hypothetical protein